MCYKWAPSHPAGCTGYEEQLMESSQRQLSKRKHPCASSYQLSFQEPVPQVCVCERAEMATQARKGPNGKLWETSKGPQRTRDSLDQRQSPMRWTCLFMLMWTIYCYMKNSRHVLRVRSYFCEKISAHTCFHRHGEFREGLGFPRQSGNEECIGPGGD